jgi:pimeloyl-ACP methyl ester carboxylesterase
MTESSYQTIRLPDGRKLAYTESGTPDGSPIVYCHGNPGSRLDWTLFDPQVALRHRARVIAIDRPGIGRSDPAPSRKLTDWPDDVCALADALGLGRFAVLGYSAGGPYAAACAYKLPDRLTVAGIASGVAPFGIPNATRGMGPGRFYFRAAAVHPLLAGLFLSMMQSGMKSATGSSQSASMPGMPPADQAAMAKPGVGASFMRSFQEACAPGLGGVAQDATLLARPWGFRPEDIRMPVYLWHGEADRNTPLAMGRYMAQAIPSCRATFYPNEGHFSLGVNHLDEILTALVG